MTDKQDSIEKVLAEMREKRAYHDERARMSIRGDDQRVNFAITHLLDTFLPRIESLMNAEPVAQGWYCAQCQRGVDPHEVTFHEVHEVCGRTITNDEPPSPQPLEDCTALRETLERIERWFGEFPDTGRYWDEPHNKKPMSYAACFGTNGERDYMREVAREALSSTAGRDYAERLRKAEEGQREALRMLSESQREVGELQGKLEASNWPVVEGWKERAEKAEEDLERANDRTRSFENLARQRSVSIDNLIEELERFKEELTQLDDDITYADESTSPADVTLILAHRRIRAMLKAIKEEK